MAEIGRRSVLGAIPAGFLGGMFGVAKVGKPAPAFTLRTFDDRKVSLADLSGKVVLLNFWALWCGPCRVEMPMFNVYVQTHPNDDLKVFAINSEDSMTLSQLRQLSAKVVFPLAKSISSQAYGPIRGALPTNYVIDRAGVVRYASAGAFDEESLDALVQPLLAEPAPGRGTTT